MLTQLILSCLYFIIFKIIKCILLSLKFIYINSLILTEKVIRVLRKCFNRFQRIVIKKKLLLYLIYFGFIYQFIDLTKEYLQYEVVNEVKIDFGFNFPSITVCSNHKELIKSKIFNSSFDLDQLDHLSMYFIILNIIKYKPAKISCVNIV